METGTVVWLIIFILIVVAWRYLLRLAQERYFPAPAEAEEGDNAEIEDDRAWRLIGYSSFLMWRTQRGKKFLDRVAKRSPRFWNAFADVGLVIVAVVMVGMLLLLLWQATLVPQIPKERAPSPKLLIGIPGLNPVIPVWYGILALAVAIVIHEFCHGFLSRVANIRVKTMGLLFFIFPIGAFVEPDEEQMTSMPRRQRMRLFAAGPTSNIILAIILALVFSWGFMAAVEPVEEGVLIRSVSLARGDDEAYPAEAAGLDPWMLIVAVDLDPEDGESGQRVRDSDEFSDLMAQTYAGQVVDVEVLEKGEKRLYQNITLADKGDYWLKFYPSEYEPEMAGQGFLGVATSNPEDIPEWLAHPLKNSGDAGKGRSVLLYMTLPFAKLQPFPDTFTDLYEPTGLVGVLPDGLFWLLANILYWVFWLNLMVGLTNALPAQPLDGGFIFADGLTAALQRIKGTILTEEHKEAIVGNATLFFSLGILFLLLFQIIGPRVIGAETVAYNAEFTVQPDSVMVGESIRFDASPTEGDFARFEWNFGDNETDEGKVVDHSYSQPGRYVVVLTAVTSDNKKSLAGSAVAVNLEESPSGSVNSGSEYNDELQLNSKAQTHSYSGRVTTGLTDSARGEIRLNTPTQEFTQTFNLISTDSQDFDWEVSEDGPGEYTLTIEVFSGSSSVDYEYDVAVTFEL